MIVTSKIRSTNKGTCDSADKLLAVGVLVDVKAMVAAAGAIIVINSY